MKKLIVALFVLGLSLSVLACNSTETPALEFASETDLASFQAVSAATLLSQSLGGIQTVALPLSDIIEEDPVIEDEIDELDKYLLMMETYLGENGALSVEPVTSDKEGYAFMIVFTTKTLAGEDVAYTLYYNETVIVEVIPEDEPEDEVTTTETSDLAMGGQRPQDGFRFHDPEDDNVVATLDGLIVIGELEYALEGKKIVNEDVTIHLLRAFIDEANHVAVRYMTSVDGDKQFFYTVVVDGVLQNRTQVKVMVQDGKVRTMLTFLEGDARGRYNFSVETVDNVTQIHINYQVSTGEGSFEKGNIFITATYDPATELTTYDYTVRPDRPMGPPQMTNNQNQNEYKYGKEHGHGKDGQQGQPRGNNF
jgi:hypothetical protein